MYASHKIKAISSVFFLNEIKKSFINLVQPVFCIDDELILLIFITYF